MSVVKALNKLQPVKCGKYSWRGRKPEHSGSWEQNVAKIYNNRVKYSDNT